MLFFISNGDGTGWEKGQWQKYLIEYVSRIPESQQVLLDCGHYVHDYEYETIAYQSKEFLNKVVVGERAN
ncbi:hypothetical protein [Clostridium sp. Marseille-Q7071]